MKTEEIVVQENQHPQMCIMLGFFLSVLGIILATMIGKGDGLKKALSGIAIRWLLAIGAYMFFREWSKSELAEHAEPKEYKQEQTIKQPVANKNWNVEVNTSPIDDSRTYTFICNGDVELGYGMQKTTPSLVVRYLEGEKTVFVTYPIYLGHGKTSVTARFDSDEAITEDWSISTDGKAVFAPWPFDDTLDVLCGSKKLVVRITPFNESPITCTFKVSGLKRLMNRTMP